jgi:hypothetical protein
MTWRYFGFDPQSGCALLDSCFSWNDVMIEPCDKLRSMIKFKGRKFKIKQSETRRNLGKVMFMVIMFAAFAMWTFVCLGDALASSSNDPAKLQAEAEDKDDWRFFVSMYGWLAGVNGTIVTAGEEADISVPFSEIFKNTKSGFMAYAEARWRKWFAAFDGTWATLGGEADTVLADLDVTIDQRIFDLRVGREMYRHSLDKKPPKDGEEWRREATVDLFLGARYFYTKQTVEITSFTGKRRESSFKDERWDPFIGFRAGYDLSKRWSVGFRGDIGGFGIGNAAEFTWQAEGTVGFKISRLFILYAGYRVLSFDLVKGHGIDKNGANLCQHGPFLGVGIRF